MSDKFKQETPSNLEKNGGLDKIKIGDIFSREGKCPIRIVEQLPDGKYRAMKVITPLPEEFLLRHFKKEELVENAILNLPNGRMVQLLSLSSGGAWYNTYPNDFVDLTYDQLEELESDKEASQAYHDLINETGIETRGKRHSRFLPRK